MDSFELLLQSINAILNVIFLEPFCKLLWVDANWKRSDLDGLALKVDANVCLLDFSMGSISPK